MTHRDYVVDRAKRVASLISAIGKNDSLRQEFHDDPTRVARGFDVHLSEEEDYMVRSCRGVDLPNLEERLMNEHFALFNANCSCD